MEGPGPFWVVPGRGLRYASYPFAVWNGEELKSLSPELTPGETHPLPEGIQALAYALLLCSDASLGYGLLVFDGRSAWYHDGSEFQRAFLGWGPGSLEDRGLRPACLGWGWQDRSHLEVVGLGRGGVHHWSVLATKERFAYLGSRAADGQYLAAMLIRPGLAAGVRSTGVDWFRRTPRGITRVATSPTVPFPQAVACFASHTTRELLVVGRDGAILRVPVAL